MAANSSSPPATGVVISFYQKGFGFIKPDSPVGDDEDLFVHYSEIQSEGYRILREGQKVKFFVSVKDDRKQAVNVTALDGSNIERPRRDTARDGVRRSGFRGDSNGVGFRSVNAVECYNCGGVGHIARDCSSNVVVRSGGNGGCYTCGGLGHIARDCTRGTGARAGGGASGGCFNCGKVGHMARDCTSVSVDGGRGSRGGNGGACFTCGEMGHMAKDCSSDGGRRGNGGGFGGGGCYSCGEMGHLARDCTGGNRGGSGGRGNSRSDRIGGYKSGGAGNDCYNCGEPGHFVRDCPSTS